MNHYSFDNETFIATGHAPIDYRPETRKWLPSRKSAASDPWLGYSDAAVSEIFIGKSF
jgi:hypothetical protein